MFNVEELEWTDLLVYTMWRRRASPDIVCLVYEVDLPLGDELGGYCVSLSSAVLRSGLD